MNPVYFDNSATTKPSEYAAAKAEEMIRKVFGNPSSLHTIGFSAEKELRHARCAVAEKLSVNGERIVFTSGGTEANNLAVIGSVWRKRKRGGRIITTAFEHPSVLQAAKFLSELGFELILIKPDRRSGRVHVEQVGEQLTPDTVLVSVMLVNHETGALQPIREIGAAVRESGCNAFFHSDCVQAFGKMPLKPYLPALDLASFSGHKIHGIKGAGALYIKEGVSVHPAMHGGGQENGLRSGTEAMPAICAFGAAAEEIEYERSTHLFKELKEYLICRFHEIGGIYVNSPVHSVDMILNISIPGYQSETLLHALAQRGIYVSSGSACGKGGKSPVLQALDLPAERITSALRISFSRYNTLCEAEMFCEALKQILTEVRGRSGMGKGKGERAF